MPSIVVFNDLHLADHPPANRREGYRDEGLEMLREVVELANRRGAAAIVSTGDLFHIKTPSRTSHSLVSAVMFMLGQARCPVYVVPGNHDMSAAGDRYEAVHQGPLGVLAQSGAVRLLWSTIAFNYPLEFAGVQLVGREYDVHRDADPTYYALRPHEAAYEGPTIMAAHGSIVPPGIYRPFPTVSVNDLDWRGIAVLATGHIHEDLGVHAASGAGLYVNLGSLGRVARTESNLTRTVKVAVVSWEQHPGLGFRFNIDEVPLDSALPAADIFLADEEPASNVDDENIKDFVRFLQEGIHFETVDLVELVHQADVPDTVRTYLMRYLEEAGA